MHTSLMLRRVCTEKIILYNVLFCKMLYVIGVTRYGWRQGADDRTIKRGSKNLAENFLLLAQESYPFRRRNSEGHRKSVLSGPFDCQLVFSVGDGENQIPALCVAFGQKGRCKMKLFETPMLVTSLLGLCLLSGLDTPPTYADFVFGTPTNLGPAINSTMHDWDQGLSRDGLSLCFSRVQLDWAGVSETWVAQRATRYDLWDDPVSLGPWLDTAASTTANAAAVVETMGGVPPGWGPADDLEIYLCHSLLGGYGGLDLFVLKRETVDAE